MDLKSLTRIRFIKLEFIIAHHTRILKNGLTIYKYSRKPRSMSIIQFFRKLGKESFLLSINVNQSKLKKSWQLKLLKNLNYQKAKSLC